jgi:hypothetical protein
MRGSWLGCALAGRGVSFVLAVEAVPAVVEPQVAREGDEALHGLPVEFGGVLYGVRGDVTEPVGLVAGPEQVPQLRGHGLKEDQEPVIRQLRPLRSATIEVNGAVQAFSPASAPSSRRSSTASRTGDISGTNEMTQTQVKRPLPTEAVG